MTKIKRLKLVPKIIFISLVTFLVILILSLSVYNILLAPVSKSNELKLVEIKPGDSADSIAKVLKENNLIKSPFVFKIYIRLNNINNLKSGYYNLSPNMGTKKIISYLIEGIALDLDSINITFPEGKNMRGIASIIENNTSNTYEDVFKTLKDDEYIDSLITKYWFLTDEIKHKDIYYPLEGYLFPDTYTLDNKDVSVTEIFEIMLDKMDKVLTRYKKDIDNKNLSIHEFLTMASIVESEGISDEDRPKIAGVFYNRIDSGMTFGSCVTACYAGKVDHCVAHSVPTKLNNPYNTYIVLGLPVGPISIPGEASIRASINPESHDFLYFLADKYKRTYFFKTHKEQLAKKEELITQKLWYEKE